MSTTLTLQFYDAIAWSEKDSASAAARGYCSMPRCRRRADFERGDRAYCDQCAQRRHSKEYHQLTTYQCEAHPSQSVIYPEWYEELVHIMNVFNGAHPDTVDIDFQELYQNGLTPAEALYEVQERVLTHVTHEMEKWAA